MTEQALALIAMLQSMVPPDARLIMCQFPGDPDTVQDSRKWRPRSWNDSLFQPDWNIYLCVSAMGRGGVDGRFRRAKECWQGGLCFMIDDLGTKLPLGLVDRLAPTALVETSPSNFQAIYVFDKLLDNIGIQEALINNFVEVHCPDSRDPGQKGVNRVFRPPLGINGKGKHLHPDGTAWRVRLAGFNPDCRYSPEQIAEAFGVGLELPQRRFRSDRAVGDRDARVIFFNEVFGILKSSGVVKMLSDGRAFNRAGWAQISCPWRNNHSRRGDTGAAIRWPDAENDFNGAFRCHHGHCEGRGWRDLVEFLEDELNARDRKLHEHSGTANEWNLR